jgi:hypothetical protein
VAVRQAELPALVEVALETGFRGFSGIYDGAFASTSLYVFAAGTMAAFAAKTFRILSLDDEPGMRCGVETLDGFLVTLSTFLRSHEGGPGNLRWRDNRAINHCTGDKKHSPDGDASENERILGPATQFFYHGSLGKLRRGVSNGLG